MAETIPLPPPSQDMTEALQPAKQPCREV